VTIGFTETGYPSAGDNVRVGAGAKIGVGTVVVTDVPKHSTVVEVAPHYLMK